MDEAGWIDGPWVFQMVPENASERNGVDFYSGFHLGRAGDEYPMLGSFLEGAFVEGDEQTILATANLIAAAPALYEALAALLEIAEFAYQHGEQPKEFAQSRAALSLARSGRDGNE